MMKGFLTTKQAAEKLNLDPSRIRQMILAGQIQAEKVGRDNFIPESEIERMKKTKRPTGRPAKEKESSK